MPAQIHREADCVSGALDGQKPISEALEETRLAQKRLNLMLHAFNQLEENDGINSKSANDFHDSSVGEAHDALNKAKKQLSATQATTAEEILRKVALLVDVDHDELLAPVKADIEVLIDPLETALGTGDFLKPPLAQLSSRDLFSLKRMTEKQCEDLSTTEQAYEVAYDQYSACRKELVRREPQSFEELALILMAMFDADDFGAWVGGDEVRARCNAFIDQAFEQERAQGEPA